jgi:hypothetical protein
LNAKSTRLAFDSKSDLYMRCSNRLPRRMSTMNATRGRSAAMKVKFCSGATPR